MDKILISEDRYGRKQNHFEDDDLIDRLNSRYTVMVLMFSQFSGTHNSYTNSICWLKGSYYLPTEEITIPDRSKPRPYHMSYYQWTPFILLGMAMFFLLPKFIWHVFTRKGGFNIRRLVQTIKDKPDAEKGVDFVKRTLKTYIDTQNKLHGSVCCGVRCRNFYVSYTVTYFIIKILYTINTLAQFFLLNSFLSFHFTGYGVEALSKLFSGDDWFESPRFPRVTMCDFMIRHLGSNQHWYAIQCNLPINIYNDKIFLGVWLWLIILTILNILSIIGWVISLTSGRRVSITKRYLNVNQSLSPEGETLLSTTSKISKYNREIDATGFTEYMHLDGFLIFDIIAKNTDEIIAGQIIEHLYRNYEPPTRNHTSIV
ncbi:unnamed protein product [Adineta steineri]|uniref:Innexin n=1 Tax=Adineta steineri TaxID=433720 RepID=A0A818HP16_9BILA|nr:unnamed protein product [Adineta steineri]CAF3509349.1 unnamed protein product [Adineta steineri]